jgi:drug/metabolite transporter (DMT)-like permease
MKATNTITIRVIISLGLLYLIWSSTFLSVRILLGYLPPLFITFSRNIVAGSLLLIWSILGKHWKKMPTKDFKTHLFAGLLLIFFGNGFMSLAGSILPSGFSSVFMALGPLLLVLFFWMAGKKPSKKKLIGTLMGMIGILILASQKSLAIPGMELEFLKGIGFLSIAVLGWNLGVFSIQHRGANTYHFTQVCSIQMITGSIIAFVVSYFIEDHSTIVFSELPLKAYGVFLYLALIGSMLGFSIFGYLSKVCDATLVATYTYVNPILALILGNIILEEKLHRILILASFFILLAVVLITTDKTKQSKL